MARTNDASARPGLLARLLREYRDDWRRGGRGFRPRWWDALALLALVAAETALVAWRSWRGDAFGVGVVSVAAVAFGVPLVLVHLVVFWRSRGLYARAANRAMLVALGCLLALLPLLHVRRKVYAASVEATKRAGSAVAEEIESYRRRHGVYPRTLWDLERDAGRPLPKPTVARTFDYFPMCDDVYTLRFPGFFLDGWVYNTLSRKWEREALD